MISEGDYVIVKTENVLRLLQVRRDRPFFLGKRKFGIGTVIGHPYGSFFDVKRNGVLALRGTPLDCEMSVPKPVDTELKDNSRVDITSNSQKLTTDDIEAFKADGVPGEEIIKIIVENNTSFKEKSVYSQEKYIKKKQSKYLEVMQILKPNTRNLVETFYSYSPQKICNLRIDTLSQMVTFCNVMSGGKYIVVDSVLGLLAASVLERIGDDGCVVQLCLAPSPTSTFRQAVDALNIPKEKLQSLLYTVNFSKIVQMLEPDTVKNMSCSSSCDTSIEENCSDNQDLPTGTALVETASRKLDMLLKVKDILSSNDMDGLLVAIKHHPSVVCNLLDYLAYSRPFAVFSMYEQPLVDCYSLLKSRKDVILLNLSETWLRKYQVLPERTHPEYSMSGTGGYLLTGVKVEKKP